MFDKDLNIMSKNLKVLEVNTEGKLFDTGLSNNSFGFDAKTRSQQKKILQGQGSVSKSNLRGSSLVVQWLGFHAFSAKGVGSVSG